MTTITEEQQQAIAEYVNSHHTPVGLGSEEEACSIAAINLALTGELTDNIPDCMSEVIGRWIIHVQDRMPDEMRNSKEWKGLLPLAAGTGRKHEKERLDIIMNWMWVDALPTIHPLADKHGFGDEWQTMLKERTEKAARTASTAAETASTAAASTEASAEAVSTASAAAFAAGAAAREGASAEAASKAPWATAWARVAADATIWAASTAAAWAAEVAEWEKLNPPGLLRKLIEVGEEQS